MTDRKERKRHPVEFIPADTLHEIAYRVYLMRMEPPLTPETSKTTIRLNQFGKVMASDEIRRKNAECMIPILRDMLRVTMDMGMVYAPRMDEGEADGE